ncbi:MAG: hypothetical protein KC561_03530 [Myxococcales bacterium]|nr:hypothetical protein [Myxococcales bacterium]
MDRADDPLALMSDAERPELSEQLHALRHEAALIPEPGLGVLEIGGRDRVSLLQGLVTADLNALRAGTGSECAFLTFKGKVVQIFGVLADESSLRLLAPVSRISALAEAIDSYVISEDVTISDRSEDWRGLLLQGPNSAAILETVGGRAPNPLEPVLRNRYASWLRLEVAGVEVIAYSFPNSAAGGAGLLVPASADTLESVVEQLIGAGAVTAGTSVRLAGEIEFGVEADFGEDTLLPELPYEHMVSWTKGCYLGQEPVARIKHRGRVQKQLAGITLDADQAAGGDPIFVGDKQVGHVTSTSSLGPDGPIGLAIVRVALIDEPQPMEVRTGGGKTIAAALRYIHTDGVASTQGGER